MSAICRLAGRQLLSQIMLAERQSLAFVRPVTMKAIPFKKPPPETFDEKNEKLKRPSSPHLTIYAPQMTSLLSFGHRLSGIALSSYLILFGVGTLVMPNDFTTTLETVDGYLSYEVWLLMKTMLVLPFAYHWTNGMRHLCWDAGKFLSLKQIYITGYITLALTATLTALFVAL